MLERIDPNDILDRLRLRPRLRLFLTLALMALILSGSWSLLDESKQRNLQDSVINWRFALLLVVLAVISSILRLKKAGEISSPPSEGRVSRYFNVSGYTAGVSKREQVWLVVEHSNKLWPKHPMISRNTRFNVSIHEGGKPPHGWFTLSLFTIGPKGAKIIKKWISRSKKQGFPGFKSEISDDSERLYSITLRLVKTAR